MSSLCRSPISLTFKCRGLYQELLEYDFLIYKEDHHGGGRKVLLFESESSIGFGSYNLGSGFAGFRSDKKRLRIGEHAESDTPLKWIEIF